MTVTRPLPAALVSRTRPLPDTGELLEALGPGGMAWLHEGGGVVTAGVAARIPVPPGPDRFAVAGRTVATLLAGVDDDDPLRMPGTGPLAMGAIPFSDRVAGELVVPAVVVGRTPQGGGWVTLTGPGDEGLPGEDGGGVQGPTRLTIDDGGGRQEWMGAVRRALARIAAGPLAKVVLAREVVVEGDRPFDRRLVLDRLRAADPGNFVYAVGHFVGASPELLLRRRGATVMSQPMAGSAPRGATAADDDRLVSELATSAKEAEEHALVVGAVRAALEPVCREVVAGSRPEAVRLATVTHLATTVGGRLHEPAPSALALAGLLHPTPAVAGLPRAEALAAIADLESFDRGLYAGPVGWVDGRGDGDWAVALRCARLDGRRAHLVAGAGIVADSDPGAEWLETEAKLEPMLRALLAG